MRWILQYVENRCGLKRRLKAASMLIPGLHKMSGNVINTDGPATGLTAKYTQPVPRYYVTALS